MDILILSQKSLCIFTQSLQVLLLAHAACLNNRIEHLPQVFIGNTLLFLMQHSVLFAIQAKGLLNSVIGYIEPALVVEAITSIIKAATFFSIPSTMISI